MGNGPGRDRFEEHPVGATLIGANSLYPFKIQGFLLVSLSHLVVLDVAVM